MSRELIALFTAVFYTVIIVSLATLMSFNLIERPSIISVVGFLFALAFLLPLKDIFQNADRIDDLILNYFSEKETEIKLALPFFALGYLSFTQGISFPGSIILNLAFRGTALIFQNLITLGPPLESLGEFLYVIARISVLGVWSLTIGIIITRLISPLQISKQGILSADIIPFSGGEAEIEIYVVTGKHGMIKVPESFCKECNMFYQSANKATEELDQEIDIQVKSYWTRFLRPLLKGGFHPPVILVDGDVISQGYNVPASEEIVDELKD